MKHQLLSLILLFFGILAPSLQANQNFAWEPVELRGKPYIPIKQVRDFYQLREVKGNGPTVILENNKAKILLTINEQRININHVKFYLSEPVIESIGSPHLSALDLESLIDPVMRPAMAKGGKAFNTVVLDPGHGGKDQGSAKLEAGLTLSVAEKARKLLENKGYRVVMTRTKDTYVSLEERVQIGKDEEQAVFVSIHFNAGQKNSRGLETYIISARAPHPAGAASVALATAVHSRSMLYLNKPEYGNEFQIDDRGIKHSNFTVLRSIPHPAILIEAGYLTNKEEATKIQSDAYQNALAKSIVRGIDVYKASIQKQPQKIKGLLR